MDNQAGLTNGYKLHLIAERCGRNLPFSFDAKTEAIRGIVDSFSTNLSRALAVISLPAHTFAAAMVDERCRCIGELRITGSVEIPHNLSIEQQRAAGPECTMARKKWDTHPNFERKSLELLQFAGSEIDRLTSAIAKYDAFQQAIEATLSSGHIMLWTAFETLATDLWIGAVNARPTSLGERALLAPKAVRNQAEPLHPERRPAVENEERRSIRLEVLRKYGFNISASIGQIVYRSRKFNFNQLQGIRTAYAAVFGNDAGAIIKNYPQLSALEAARNVLVHRGGIVDKAFLERVRKDKSLGCLAEGARLPVTCEMFAQFLSTTMPCARDLLSFVDNRLQEATT